MTFQFMLFRPSYCYFFEVHPIRLGNLFSKTLSLGFPEWVRLSLTPTEIAEYTTALWYILKFALSDMYTSNKCKVQSRPGHGDPEREYRYSSTLSLTSALDGWGWSVPLNPGKDSRYSLCRRLGGPQSRSGWVRKFSLPPAFDPRILQPVASRYTDCSIPAHVDR